MKKRIVLVLLTLALAVGLASCGSSELDTSFEEPTQIGSFDKADRLPAHIAVSENNNWYTLTCPYGANTWKFSRSNDPSKLQIDYSTAGVEITSLSCEGDYAAWVEKSTDNTSYRVMLYECSTGNVIEPTKMECDGETMKENMQLGFYNGRLYYSITNYVAKTTRIVEYDCVQHYGKTIYTNNDYYGEGMNTFEIKDGILVANVRTGKTENTIKYINMNTGEEDGVTVPESVREIQSVSYDATTKKFAICYNKTEAESQKIATFKKGDKKLTEVYTLKGDDKVYNDKIKIVGNHIFWVNKSVTNGQNSDFLNLIDYNCKTEKTEQIDNAYDFCFTSEAMYTLCYRGNGLNNVQLLEWKIKK